MTCEQALSPVTIRNGLGLSTALLKAAICLGFQMNVRLCQTSCPNFRWRFIGSIHVLHRRCVLQMKEQSLFYLSKQASSVPDHLLEKVPFSHNNRPTHKKLHASSSRCSSVG